MAVKVLDNAFVSFAGNDISANVKSVTLNYAAEMLDKTAMGDTTRSKIGGMFDWSVSLELHQDHAAAALDSLMFDLVGTTGALIIREDSAAKGASNPEYTGNAVLESYPPLGGGVGDLGATSMSLQAAGALGRAVA